MAIDTYGTEVYEARLYERAGATKEGAQGHLFGKKQ